MPKIVRDDASHISDLESISSSLVPEAEFNSGEASGEEEERIMAEIASLYIYTPEMRLCPLLNEHRVALPPVLTAPPRKKRIRNPWDWSANIHIEKFILEGPTSLRDQSEILASFKNRSKK